MASFGRRIKYGRLRLVALAAAASLAAACAGMNAPDPGAPRANEPAYPLTIAAGEERREAALAVWTTFMREQGVADAPAPELQPATATVRALPALTAPLRLPQVGDAEAEPETAEEAVREALRRFIVAAQPLVGIQDQRRLSLIEIAGGPNGMRTARYRQRPFLYPVRGGYGHIEIVFAPDRRIVSLSSTALPETERLARLLATLRPNLTATQAVARLAGRAFTYTDAAGREQTRTVAATEATEAAVARELVVYPLLRAEDATVLNIHLAWEISVGPDALVYVDALSGEIIAAAPAAPA